VAQEDSLARLYAIKAIYEPDLLRKANVVGVGIGLRQRGGKQTAEPVIVVSVTRKVPLSQLDASDVIPRELEGVPVDVQAVGKLRAL
jgi:hypothetical protein